MGLSGWLKDVHRDLQFGFRMLARAPGFSFLVILCLTLGVGANAAVFSWIEGILLRPYPAVAHLDRLLVLAGTIRGESPGEDVSWPDFQDLKKDCTLFDAFIADKITGTTLNIGDRAERVAASIVSSNYFDALEIHPLLGRGFQPAEDQGRNAHPVTVISYWLWKERYHGDREIIGKTQLLNGVPHTIIGVAPEGFYGTFVGYPIQFWVPISMQEVFEPGGYLLEDRGARWIEGFVRLKPGVSRSQAKQEIATAAKRLENDFPATNRGRGIDLLPLWKDPFNQAGNQLPMLRLASAVVFLLLLIVCANVSNLLLVRSFARKREVTIRLAMGAGRSRLLRQLFTEGLILSSIAALGGVLVAYLCRNLVSALFPLSRVIAVKLTGEIDARVLAISAGVCIFATLLFSLFPAIHNSRIDLAGALKSESGAVFGERRKSRAHGGLVVVQMSLSFVLLVASILLIESVGKIRVGNPGFSTQDVLTTSVDLVSAKYDLARARNFRDALVDRIQSIAGVESAAFSRVQPFTYSPFPSATIAVEGYQPGPDERPLSEYNLVGPGYLATLGIPLLSGREFTRADNETSPAVAIVNEPMVAHYWRGQDPLGRRFQVDNRWVQVVGVAKLAKYDSFAEPPKPFFYVPLRQSPFVAASLDIRTSIDPATIAPQLSRLIRSLDANLAPKEIITMRVLINRVALASQQIGVTLLAIFGGLALLLAGVGLYGVMSYAVQQRTRELGLRMALGANGANLLRLVMGRGLLLLAVGVLIGAGVALMLGRLITNLLYDVSPRDPLAFVSALLILTIASGAAVIFPAWRASGIDPGSALRE